MSMFNQPPRPPSPGMDRGAQMAARRAERASKPKTARGRAAQRNAEGTPQTSGPEAKRRLREAQNLMPMPRRSEPRPLPPGLEGQQNLMPPAGSFDRQAGQTMRDSLRPIASFLDTPGRVVRGAVEGGIRGVNPDFQMPSLNDAQMPGIDFMNFITGSGLQDESEQIPLPRSFDPGTDALLRAIMRQMQGGQ